MAGDWGALDATQHACDNCGTPVSPTFWRVWSVDGTLDLNGDLEVNEKYALELEDLLLYREYAGQYDLRETLDSTQRFSEQIDESVLTTLVIGIEPSDDLQDRGIPGVWGLVDDVRDERSSTLTRSAVGIDITILAPFSEFGTVSAVKSSLKL